MNISKREKIMVIAAGGVFVIALVYQFVLYPGTQKKSKPSRKPTAQRQTQQTPAGATAKSPQQSKTEKSASANIQNYDSWGRDPFSVKMIRSGSSWSDAETAKKRKPSHTLKAIFWKQGKPYVLIDDDIILAEGENKSGITILRIENDRVVYRQGGRSYSLYLKED